MSYQNDKMRYLTRKKKESIERQRFNNVHPVAQWDKEKLMMVASDRGYRTRSAVAYAIAQELEITMGSAKWLLNNGAFTWGQAIVIGALFEMTPKEFADSFLAGYFKEVRDGDYRAVIEDKTEFIGKKESGQS